LNPERRDEWSARLFYAYADALLAAGRIDEARQWFVAAALADEEGTTDAAERIELLDGGAVDEKDAADGDTDADSDRDDDAVDEPPTTILTFVHSPAFDG
jgi:hypothetical protein